VADYIHRRKSSGSILDVGCATGYFLTRFFSGGEWKRCGVELSRKFAQRAAESGIRIHCGDVFQMPSADEGFDVITVLDAFYYFPDPHAVLANLRRRLKPGGLLLLELPLAGSRIWRGTSRLGMMLSGTRDSLLQSSDHLFYYSTKSITLLCERSGFDIQSVYPLPGNWHSRPLRNNLTKYFSYLSSALNTVSGSRIFLGPRFLVAAVNRMPSIAYSSARPTKSAATVGD
jgi:SAM-dependent methyltransferase